MRKAAVMIGFGAFFLTLALLMRFYAYPKLAVVPSDQNTQQLVTDDHASYFDADTLKPGAGKIITKGTVVANKEMTKKASKELGRDDVLVLDQWQTTDNVNDKGQTTPPPMDASTQQYAIDKSSGEALKWSGNTLDGKPTNYEGQTIKFPFQVDKDKSYRYWDSTLGKAFPMKYVGTEDVEGLKTYKYTQTIPKTKFTTMDVPGEIFGLPKGSKLADRYYTNDRTIWVEPETGVMMKLQEKQHQTLEVPNAKPVDAMLTTSTMTDETVKKNVDDYKTKASQLKILRLWAPLLLGLLGLFALLLGLLVSLRAGRQRRAGRHERRDEHVQDSTLVFGDPVQAQDAHGAHVVGERPQADERGQF